MQDTHSATGVDFASRVLAAEPWTPTPLLPAPVLGDRLGVEVWLKREDCTPVGSFKLRGALVAMERLGDNAPAAGVWVASAGNFGLAVAVAGARRRMPVTVVVPNGATSSKVERIRLAGAAVTVHGDDFDEAKDFARHGASAARAAFWEDGSIPELADGAATISVELLEHPDYWDSVLVPVGNGSLIKGVAGVLKARSPTTAVIGLVPSGAPSMFQAMKGRPWDEQAGISTLADGLAVRVPIAGIVAHLDPLVDDVWLVDESKLLPAVRSLMVLESILVEPSASIALAGLAEHRASFAGKRVALIVTGAHIDMSLMPDVLAGEPLV